MEQPYVIGIDIGTGSTKGVAVNAAGTVVATSQAYYTTQHAAPGFAEQDPVAMWQAFIQCLQQLVQKTGAPPSLISLSSCMHSIMAVDSKGKPLTPLINWADTRSERVAEDLRNAPDGEDIYKHTGTPVHSMSPLCKLVWMQQHQPEICKAAAKFISIKEYIWYQLFGVFEVDHSIASATGLLDIHKLQWYAPAIHKAGISSRQLSTPVPTGYLQKKLPDAMATLLNLPNDTSFCIGASDGCTANVGSFAVGPAVAALTIGTSGAVRIASNAPLTDYEAMLFNYRLDENTFICGGPINNGGNILQWLLKKFLGKMVPTPADYEDVFRQVQKVPAGSEGLLFLPYLLGERAPLWDEKACGAFIGVRHQHTAGHFLRAALEGVCYALSHVIQSVEKSTGALKCLHVSGGFTHSQVWMQLLANVTGKELHLYQTEDASAIGAALMGMKNKGLIKTYDNIKMQTPIVVMPQADAVPVYQQAFDIYKNLYPALKDAMHRLHPSTNN